MALETKYIKNKTIKDYELLMPAGSFEKAKFAIAYGADAIYCGIPMFTLRGKSTMKMDELRQIVPYAHKRGVKVYFAVNIFPHSFKYKKFLSDMKVMVEEIKPDAFIMSDPGLIDITRERWPKVVLHLSVQANNVNWMSANFWYKQGIARVILARELTLREVEEIHKRVPNLELEFFIHGSNCIAYSGRCLLSNYFNYRDSNQGVCNNACRFLYKTYKSEDEDYFEPLQGDRHYKDLAKGTYFVEEQERKGELFQVEEDSDGTYLFNSRDNCMAEHLEKLIAAGVISFKVEGRTKSIYYAAIVARTYRRLFDDILAGRGVDVDWAIKELNTTSNRGFIPGFLEGNPKENSIDYAKKSSNQSHLFAGVVRGIRGKRLGNRDEGGESRDGGGGNREERLENRDGGGGSRGEKGITYTTVEVEVRSKFQVGDELEFVEPLPEKVKIWKVDKIMKSPNKELKKVSGGLEFNIILEVPFEIKSEYCVIRRKLYEGEGT